MSAARNAAIPASRRGDIVLCVRARGSDDDGLFIDESCSRPLTKFGKGEWRIVRMMRSCQYVLRAI
jgi:hypothetical protein